MSRLSQPVLPAADNANDVESVLAALRAARLPNKAVGARDGEAALEFLRGWDEPAASAGATPAVVVFTSSRAESHLLATRPPGINPAKTVELDKFIRGLRQPGQFRVSIKERPPPPPGPAAGGTRP